MEIGFKIATPKPQLSVLLRLILQQEGFGKNLFLLLPKNALEVAACLTERPPSDYLRKEQRVTRLECADNNSLERLY